MPRKKPVSKTATSSHQRAKATRTGGPSQLRNDIEENLGFHGNLPRRPAPTLVRRGKTRRLILTTPTSRFGGHSLILKPYFPWSTVAAHLTTQTIFKGISVIDWLIIYQDLEDNHQSRAFEQNLVRGIILSLCTRFGEFVHWDQRIKPLRPSRVLKFIKPDDPFNDLDEDEPESINEFLELGCCPKKSTASLYSLELEYQMKPKIPDPRYIGVGYKDHGHLPDPTEVRVPEPEDWKPTLDCSLDIVVERVKDYLRSR